eukprot:SAG11_NODE_1146_length_5684_cov_59.423277_4_plen_155_part_00
MRAYYSPMQPAKTGAPAAARCPYVPPPLSDARQTCSLRSGSPRRRTASAINPAAADHTSIISARGRLRARVCASVRLCVHTCTCARVFARRDGAFQYMRCAAQIRPHTLDRPAVRAWSPRHLRDALLPSPPSQRCALRSRKAATASPSVFLNAQ